MDLPHILSTFLGPICHLLKILEAATEGFEISNFAQRRNSTSSTNLPKQIFLIFFDPEVTLIPAIGKWNIFRTKNDNAKL